jgi:transposase
MSKRDVQRIEVLSKVVDGRMSIVTASHVLAIGTHLVQRLINRLETAGAASIGHKANGRPSNNKIAAGVLGICRTKCTGG